MSEVVGIWLSVAHPGLAHDENVVAETERVSVDGTWSEVEIGVVARSLAGGRAVKVPFWEIFDRFWLLLESLEEPGQLPTHLAVNA